MTDDYSQPDLSAYAEDAAQPDTVGSTDNILARITTVARDLREAQAHVAEAQEALKAAQDRERQLTEFTLPQLMDEAKQRLLVDEDGYTLERSEVVRASISADNMPKAVSWLKGAGHPIFKHHVGQDFDKDEEQAAARAVDALRDAGFTPTDKYTVHPQTLGALVRELMKDGKPFPADLLGVYVQPIIKMKPPKGTPKR